MTAPFEITRWESPHAPTVEFLERWLAREGLEASLEEYANGNKSPEMKFAAPYTRVLLSGHIQCAFPGYGVVDLAPGDRVDIEANVLHDITVTSHEPARLYAAPAKTHA